MHEYLLAAPLGTRLVRSSSPRFNSVISVAATNRIRPCCAIPQQKFNHDVLSLALRHRCGFLKLDGRARFDHIPIVRPYLFGNIHEEKCQSQFSRRFGHAELDGGVSIRGSLERSEAQDP